MTPAQTALTALQGRIASSALTAGDVALLTTALGAIIPLFVEPGLVGPDDSSLRAEWFAPLYAIASGNGGSAVGAPLAPNATTSGGVATVQALAQAGSTATASLSANANDNAGTISLTPGGSGITSGEQAGLLFNSAYPAGDPRAIVLFPLNAAAAAVAADIYVTPNSDTSFFVTSAAALTSGTLYEWAYIVLG